MRKYLQILKKRVFINSLDWPGFKGLSDKLHGKKETAGGSQAEAFLPVRIDPPKRIKRDGVDLLRF